MKKIILSIFLSMALLLTACHVEINVSPKENSSSNQNATTSSNEEPAKNPDTTSDSNSSNSGNLDAPTSPEITGNNTAQALADFNSIEIDVLAADIQIVNGSELSVSYNFSDKEPIKKMNVIDGILYIETSFNPMEIFDRSNNWFVTITIPEGTTLLDVDLETISGNIDVSGISCNSCSVSSKAGTINVNNLNSTELDAESISGDIRVVDTSSSKADFETISSNLDISGTFGELETSSVSGNTNIVGSISMPSKLESTSGNISLSVNQPISLMAQSTGSITMNGKKSSSPLRTVDGIPVEIQSISGKIAVQSTN